MPEGEYLLIPEVSSERRNYIPIGFIQPEVISSNLVKIIPNSTLYHFGILTSAMHMTWVKYTCGQTEKPITVIPLESSTTTTPGRRPPARKIKKPLS